MDYITELPLIDSKNDLFVCIGRFLEFSKLTLAFLGGGKSLALSRLLLFFDFVVRLFRVPSSGVHNGNVHFTA